MLAAVSLTDVGIFAGLCRAKEVAAKKQAAKEKKAINRQKQDVSFQCIVAVVAFLPSRVGKYSVA